MEKITCVIDATTLVEHIHEIKSWIYNGQLRLVVPLNSKLESCINRVPDISDLIASM